MTLVNVPNGLLQTPLMFAVSSMFVGEGPVGLQPLPNFVPLFPLQAYHGRDDVISFLLKQASSLVLCCVGVCWPYHRTSADNVDPFDNQGADPWAADRCGRRTALHYACMKGYPACVRALLENLSPEHQEREHVRWEGEGLRGMSSSALNQLAGIRSLTSTSLPLPVIFLTLPSDMSTCHLQAGSPLCISQWGPITCLLFGSCCPLRPPSTLSTCLMRGSSGSAVQPRAHPFMSQQPLIGWAASLPSSSTT